VPGEVAKVGVMALGRVHLSVTDARDLAEGALRGFGFDHDEARIVADHVIDAALCGYEYSGLAKILNTVDSEQPGRIGGYSAEPVRPTPRRSTEFFSPPMAGGGGLPVLDLDRR
jgi:LDH2 family malate/lactate/ureidoglycolate dehydrogenase